jgi:folate-binding protein YgfZ
VTSASADCRAELDALGVIAVGGGEAADFLAAQITSDVRVVSAGRGQLGAWCTPQGRVIAVIQVLHRGDGYWLLLPRELLTPVRQRLQRYVLRARVRIDEMTGIRILGVLGTAAIEAVAGHTPAGSYSVTTVGDTLCVRQPGADPRFLVLGHPGSIASHWASALAAAAAMDANAWSLLDISAGIPTVTAATSGHFLPQMLNLDALDAVSFTKGCYPGQEIVARVKYRGEVKRRLYPGDTMGPVRIGDRLVAGDEAQAIGEVVTVATRPEGGLALLAVLQPGHAAGDGVRVGTLAGPIARFTMPPYPLPG